MSADATPSRDWAALLPAVAALVRQAGARILEVRDRGFDVERKADSSPVTEADLASERVILPALRALTPEITVISEEAVSAHGAPEVRGACFWLVDPLDGTREFARGGTDFTVNIGLVEGGRPVLGVIGVPAQDTIYTGAIPGGATMAVGDGAPRPIEARLPPVQGLTVVASRSHGDLELLEAYLADKTVKKRVSAGSALKLAMLARGEADLYPRFGRTMEWDTAAGHAVLSAAGGRVETAEGAPLLYGKPGYENPHFIAFGRR